MFLSRACSLPYPQTLKKTRKACQGLTLQLIKKIRSLRANRSCNIGPWSSNIKLFYGCKTIITQVTQFNCHLKSLPPLSNICWLGMLMDPLTDSFNQTKMEEFVSETQYFTILPKVPLVPEMLFLEVKDYSKIC